MKQVPLLLVGLAAIGMGIGFLSWFIEGVFSQMYRYWFLDYVFYWRGAMALLTTAIVITLLQIRDK